MDSKLLSKYNGNYQDSFINDENPIQKEIMALGQKRCQSELRKTGTTKNIDISAGSSKALYNGRKSSAIKSGKN